MKLKKKYLIFPVLLILLFLMIYMNYDKIRFAGNEYEIIDHFADTTDSGIFKFVFVEVNENKEDYVKYLSKDIKKDFSPGNSNERNILIIHYYDLKDTVPMKGKLLNHLNANMPVNEILKADLDTSEMHI